jgi:hypothetical protein
MLQMLQKAVIQNEGGALLGGAVMGGCSGSALLGGCSGAALLGGEAKPKPNKSDASLINIPNPNYIKLSDRDGSEGPDELQRYIKVGRNTDEYEAYYNNTVVPRIAAKKESTLLKREALAEAKEEQLKIKGKTKLSSEELCMLKSAEAYINKVLKKNADKLFHANGNKLSAEEKLDHIYDKTNRNVVFQNYLEMMRSGGAEDKFLPTPASRGSGLKRSPLTEDQKVARKMKQLQKLQKEFSAMKV